MRFVRRIPVWAGTAVVGAAIGAAVAVLAMAGAHAGGTRHAKPAVAQIRAQQQRLRAEVHAELAQVEARYLSSRPSLSCARGRPATGHLPRERYGRAVRIAEKYLGVRYVWGGASPSGFDSSGLVMYVYKKLGVSLPHYTVAQYCYAKAVRVPRSKLEPGDLVFFYDRSHVGIYIGNHEFIHEPHTGAVVRIESLTGAYAHAYYGATRILG